MGMGSTMDMETTIGIGFKEIAIVDFRIPETYIVWGFRGKIPQEQEAAAHVNVEKFLSMTNGFAAGKNKEVIFKIINSDNTVWRRIVFAIVRRAVDGGSRGTALVTYGIFVTFRVLLFLALRD